MATLERVTIGTSRLDDGGGRRCSYAGSKGRMGGKSFLDWGRDRDYSRVRIFQLTI